jgi:hypothetical protein
MQARTTLALAVLVLALPTAALATGSWQPPRKYALLIGNSAYEAPFPQISGRLDAADLASVLSSRDGFDVGTPVLDQKSGTMRDALQEFSRRIADADVVLFFFSGHGVQFAGQNYLVGTDGLELDEHGRPRTTLSLSEVIGALSSAQHATKIIILDACREPLPNLQAGLAEVGSADDLFIAYAVVANGTAPAKGPKQHSPYSEQLLARAAIPGLEWRDLVNRVHDSLIGRQATWASFSAFPGEVFLRDPVQLRAQILSASGDLSLVLNGKEVVNSKNDQGEKLLHLSAEHTNEIDLKIFKQKTFRHGQVWERVEGWCYAVKLVRQDDGQALDCCRDRHDVPFRDGPEVDHPFTAARIFIDIDSTPAVPKLVVKLQPHAWKDDAPFGARDEVLYRKNVSEWVREQLPKPLRLLVPSSASLVVVRGNGTLAPRVASCMGQGGDRLRDLAEAIGRALAGDTKTPGDEVVKALSQCVGEPVSITIEDGSPDFDPTHDACPN